MRLFVAVDLPDRIKERLAAVVGELRACRADVGWVSEASMHVTLKFLGDVEPREVSAIDETLRRVAGAAAPAAGRLHNIGSFPHLRRPRVLWIGVETADDRLQRIQAAVEDGLAEHGFAREKRRFHPHLTLGRLRGQRGLAELVAAIEQRGDIDLGEFAIDELTLFQSDLRRSGAVYTALGVYPLG